jgi:hypothetical protein
MMLLSTGMALGKMDILKAEGGELTVPLDQWQRVVFLHHGKRIAVSVSEIFKALEEERL